MATNIGKVVSFRLALRHTVFHASKTMHFWKKNFDKTSAPIGLKLQLRHRVCQLFQRQSLLLERSMPSVRHLSCLILLIFLCLYNQHLWSAEFFPEDFESVSFREGLLRDMIWDHLEYWSVGNTNVDLSIYGLTTFPAFENYPYFLPLKQLTGWCIFMHGSVHSNITFIVFRFADGFRGSVDWGHC